MGRLPRPGGFALSELLSIKRRTNSIILSKKEWQQIVETLESCPTTLENCKPAITTLRALLDRADATPDKLITIEQPPLSWSPIITALALNVLTQPNLLSIAERIRSQLEAQAKCIGGPLKADETASGVRWRYIGMDGIDTRIDPN
jgi:hypothetical protein